jgi:hypothetical protein
MSNSTSTISKQQLKSECLSNKINLASTDEHVRYIDQRSGDVVIETYSDFFKYNGGSSKSNSEIDTFVPAFEV